jgi:hypothetical protein
VKRLLTLILAATACTSLPNVEPAPVVVPKYDGAACAGYLRAKEGTRSYAPGRAAHGGILSPAVAYADAKANGDSAPARATWFGRCGSVVGFFDTATGKIAEISTEEPTDLCASGVSTPFGNPFTNEQTSMIRILQTGEGDSRVVCGFISLNNPDFPASGGASCVSASLTFDVDSGTYLNAFEVQTSDGPTIRFVRKTFSSNVLEAVDVTAKAMKVVSLTGLPTGATLEPSDGSTGLFTAGEGGSGTMVAIGKGQPLDLVNFDELGKYTKSRAYRVNDPSELSFIFGSGYSLIYGVGGTTYTASFALEDRLLAGRSANGLVEQGRPRLGYLYGSAKDDVTGATALDWSTLADVTKPLPNGYVEEGSTARIDQLQVAAPTKVELSNLDRLLIAMSARAVSPEKKRRAVLFSVGGGAALGYLANKAIPKLNGISIGALPGNYGFGVGAYPLGAGTGVLALPKNAIDDAWSGGACNDAVLLVLPLNRSL